MKSLMLLLQELLAEAGSWCRTSTTADMETIRRRVEHEGLSFLTITLPSFGKALEKALDLGYCDPAAFAGFTCRGGLPVFLGGFLDLVFDRGTGRLLHDPDVEAIRILRQITLMFGKIEVPCSDARRVAAIQGYMECEQDVRAFDATRTAQQYADFERVAGVLWSDILDPLETDVFEGHVIPRHGSGSTAEGVLGNKKYRQREWTSRLEEMFPHGEFLVPNDRYTREGVVDHVNILEPRDERPVKVITVPKTLKTPRIIAKEPICMMYVQQALLPMFTEAIEGHDTLSYLVGFSDQSVNNRLAQEGSKSGALATLDLSEASDRVSNQLVRSLLRRWPWISRAVDACRSRKADVPGHGVIRLAKFASMGSALTFPIEAMVFCTVIFVGIQRELNRPLTRGDVESLRGQVRVYGDDIIVPVEFVLSVIAELEAFGFRVNASKSFWTGRFRESCGKEYFDGHDVSIVRVRRMPPTSRKDADGVMSIVSLRNQLYRAGWWQTCASLDERIRRVIPFPVVLDTSPVLGRHSFLGYQAERTETGKNLQRPLVRGAVSVSALPPNPVRNEFALLKILLSLERREPANWADILALPAADEEHLTHSGRPDQSDIKIRWSPAF